MALLLNEVDKSKADSGGFTVLRITLVFICTLKTLLPGVQAWVPSLTRWPLSEIGRVAGG